MKRELSLFEQQQAALQQIQGYESELDDLIRAYDALYAIFPTSYDDISKANSSPLPSDELAEEVRESEDLVMSMLDRRIAYSKKRIAELAEKYFGVAPIRPVKEYLAELSEAKY